MSQESLACVQVTLAIADPEMEACIEDALWCVEIEGLERQDDDTWSALVEDPRPRTPGSVRWRVFSSASAPDRLQEAVSAMLAPLDTDVAVEYWSIDDLSFMETWKQFFRPARVSSRIVVHPPWDVPDEAPGVERVMIEPGMAFGTGTHETTRLCIDALDRLLERWPEPAPDVLDVGTGSGILAIAAAQLGAGLVTGVENDPAALDIARENARLNGVLDLTRFPDTQVDNLSGHFDIVVANILPHVLISLREHLIRLVGSDGALILSGILITERPSVLEAFASATMNVESTPEMGEWCALVLRKEAR